MGTLTSFTMMTVDGSSEGPNGEFDFWTDAGDEFDTFSTEQTREVATPGTSVSTRTR